MNTYFVKFRFYVYKVYRLFLNKNIKFNLNNRSKILHTLSVDENDSVGNVFKSINFDIDGKYFWKVIPDEFELCKTSEVLGVKEVSLVQVFTKDNKKFIELCKPEGFGVIYMKLLQPSYFLDSYYQSDYDDEALKISVNPSELKSKRSNNKVERFCNYFLKSNSKILDVGCGFGDQLSHFNEKGHLTKGIEPGKRRAEFARTVYGLDIINIDLETITDANNMLGEKYDLIYMNHVFEHLANPIGLLKSLINYLETNGRIFIAIPNFHFEGVLVKMLSPVHTHSFTTIGLLSIAAKLGLELEKNYSNDQYNIMIFKKGEVADMKNDDTEIQDSIQDLFCISKNIKVGDYVFAQTQTLGTWTSFLKCISIDSDAQFPIIIKTDFSSPKLLFK